MSPRLALLLCALPLAACQSAGDASSDAGQGAPPGDAAAIPDAPARADAAGPRFGLTIAPSAVRLIRGAGAVTVTVTVARAPGFAGSIDLVLESLPGGVSAPPVEIAGGDTSATITLAAAADAPLGQFAAQLSASGGGGVLDAPLALAVTDAPGTIDLTWNGGSPVVVEPFGLITYDTRRVLLRPGGEILFSALGVVASQWKLAIYQLGSDGALDPAFGAGGEVTVNNFRVRGNALAPDGKLVVIGDAEPTSLTTTLLRFDGGGQPDLAFGGSSSTPSSFVDSTGTAPIGLEIQSTGAIVYAQLGAANRASICRLTSAGLPDATFARGQRCWAATASGATLSGLTIAPDDDVFAAGTWGAFPRFYAVHLTAAADQAHEAELPVVAGSIEEAALSVGVSDGKTLVAGYGVVPGSVQVAVAVLARLDDTGADPAFTPVLRSLSSDGGYSELIDVATQADGKIVAVGSVSVGGIGHGIIMRFTDAGVLDPTFGVNGMVSEPAVTYFRAVAIQPDGRIVAAGVSPMGWSSRATGTSS